MKIKKMEITVYELGDLLDISSIIGTKGKPSLTSGNRAVIIAVRELKNGQYSYDVLTDKGKRTGITPDEMRGEQLIGNIDISALFIAG